jgi:hypothetical protein
MEIIMKIKSLFSYLILTTVLPLSASYGMDEEKSDYGVHTLGHRVERSAKKNSAGSDIAEAIEPFTAFARYTREVHGILADDVRSLRDFLSKMSDSRLLKNSASIRSAREQLLTFFNTESYIPKQASAGVKAAESAVLWAKLELDQASIEARYFDRTADVREGVQDTETIKSRLDRRAQTKFEQGEESLQEFVTYTGMLANFIDLFHSAVTRAIVTVKNDSNYNEQFKPQASFVAFLQNIQLTLNNIRHLYDLQTEEGIFAYADVLTFLRERCLVDPVENASATKETFEKKRREREEFAKERLNRTRAVNVLISKAWMEANSTAARWEQPR